MLSCRRGRSDEVWREDDAVRAFVKGIGLAQFFGVFFRAMTRRCRTRCLRLCALGILRMRSNFVVMRTNRGAPQASTYLFSSPSLQFVRYFSAAVLLQLQYFIVRQPLRRHGAVEEDEEGDWKQTACDVKDHLHVRRPRFTPIVCRTCFVCYTLGDYLGFMQRAAE